MGAAKSRRKKHEGLTQREIEEAFEKQWRRKQGANADREDHGQRRGTGKGKPPARKPKRDSSSP